MSSSFEIDTDASGAHTTVLRARGVLDARSAPVLTHRCAEVRSQERHLVLELSGVTFIASSGVGALLALVEEFRNSPCRIRLAAVSPAILSVVKLLNLDAFLHLCPSEAQAVAQLEAFGDPRRGRAA